MADDTYITKIYNKLGGDEMVVASGGKITVESGGVINLKTGAALQNNGTPLDVSGGVATATDATTAELDTLHDVTAGTAAASKAVVLDANKALDVVRTASLRLGTSGSETAITATGAELNVLAAVTAGTAKASAAVVLDANKALDVVRTASLRLGTSGSETAVTATGAELNVLAAVTPGTAKASAAVVLDANKALDAVRTASLLLGASGSETAVTSTAAELNILDGVTATAAELNMAADSSANVETVDAANVITAAESGKTFFLSSATEFASTLPAAAAGLRYTFIVAAAPSSASYTIATPALAGIIVGQQHSADGEAGDSGATDNTITFVDSQAVAGDRVDLICDGTNWFAQAFSKVAAGITFTTAT